MNRLQKIDELNIGDHYYLHPDDDCYFFGTFTSSKGYSHSETNQLIYNFKKEVLYKGHPSWKYKEKAVKTINELLTKTFNANREIFSNSTIIPMPPSKTHGHPKYDNRLAWSLSDYFKNINDLNINAVELILCRESMEPFHYSNARPKPEDLAENMFIDDDIDIEFIGEQIVIYDDVLTTGSHFVAAKKTILERFPGKNVIGLFIARREIINSAIDDFSDYFQT